MSDLPAGGYTVPAYFAIDPAVVSESVLRAALRSAAEAFDDDPKTMVAVLAGDSSQAPMWFTFRCSSLGPERVMSSGFFEDCLSESLPELVCLRVSDRLPSDRAMTVWRGGEIELQTRSDGAYVLISRGHVPASVARTGDAATFALAALGWAPELPFDELRKNSRRLDLIRDRIVVEPAAADGPLPPVGVSGFRSSARFDYWRDRALEVFEMSAPKLAADPDKPTRVDVSIGKPQEMPSFAGILRVTGAIEVIDDCESLPDYGIDVVDLGDIEEMKYPCRLVVQGAVKAVRGLHLVRADELSFYLPNQPEIEFPLLRRINRGSFGSDNPVEDLELPELIECKTLSLKLGWGSLPFRVRLPKLRKGTVTFEIDNKNFTIPEGSEFVAPVLPPESVTVTLYGSYTRGDVAAIEAQLRALAARSTSGPSPGGLQSGHGPEG